MGSMRMRTAVNKVLVFILDTISRFAGYSIGMKKPKQNLTPKTPKAKAQSPSEIKTASNEEVRENLEIFYKQHSKLVELLADK